MNQQFSNSLFEFEVEDLGRCVELGINELARSSAFLLYCICMYMLNAVQHIMNKIISDLYSMHVLSKYEGTR